MDSSLQKAIDHASVVSFDVFDSNGNMRAYFRL